jgi:hypothetical protein
MPTKDVGTYAPPELICGKWFFDPAALPPAYGKAADLEKQVRATAQPALPKIRAATKALKREGNPDRLAGLTQERIAGTRQLTRPAGIVESMDAFLPPNLSEVYYV